MPLTLDKIYMPLTASPYRHDKFHIEIPPCDALKPYVRCFWGTEGIATGGGESELERVIVIPDTCMDIILTVNFTKNKFYDNFCGLSNQSFISWEDGSLDKFFTFGVRFYAWSVILFADDDMRGVLNSFVDSGMYFKNLRRELCAELAECRDIFERARITERFLLRRLENSTRMENPDVMNALYFIIKNNGNVMVDDLCRQVIMSKRTLERMFAVHIGASPKQMINMMRYQMLWSDVLRPDFNVHDAVYKFGFFDQAHLLNYFRKYHSISLSEAREFARDELSLYVK